MNDKYTNKSAPGPSRSGPTFRCDHCRRLLGRRVDNYWYDMICASALQHASAPTGFVCTKRL